MALTFLNVEYCAVLFVCCFGTKLNFTHLHTSLNFNPLFVIFLISDLFVLMLGSQFPIFSLNFV